MPLRRRYPGFILVVTDRSDPLSELGPGPPRRLPFAAGAMPSPCATVSHAATENPDARRLLAELLERYDRGTVPAIAVAYISRRANR
jgi:hypothetical protein